MSLRQRVAPDLLLIFSLLLAPLLMFHQQTLGNRTLLPSENLYQHLPYSAYRDVVKAPAIPHNHLLSDMVLQNYQWKRFIRAQIAEGEIPLWNPHIFAGAPFLAAGQHSALYPLSVMYYVLPLSAAYGWFVLVNLWLAGLFMAGYMRAIGVNRAGAALAGLVYQLSGFMIAGAVFPMMLAAAVWLPLILWMIENILRGRSLSIFRGTALVWVVIGALAVCCNVLAGHIELTIYTLLIAGYYGVFRLIWLGIRRWRATGRLPLFWAARMSIWLLLLALLGLGLAALQLMPLYEFVGSSWRAERSSLETVLGYAHAPRDLLQFLLPNFYGNPAHHSYTDAFSWRLDHGSELNAGGTAHRAYRVGRQELCGRRAVSGCIATGAWRVMPWSTGLCGGVCEQVAIHLPVRALLALIALSFMFGLANVWLALPLAGHESTQYAFSLGLCAEFGCRGAGWHRPAYPDAAGATWRFIHRALILLHSWIRNSCRRCLVVQAAFEQFAPLFERVVAEMAYADGAFRRWAHVLQLSVAAGADIGGVAARQRHRLSIGGAGAAADAGRLLAHWF